MRAGPLSNDKVIQLLNTYFVPVYAINEDYVGKDAIVPAEERKEFQRIYHESLEAKRSCGTVSVYILAPDGQSIDSLVVPKSAVAENCIDLLERNIRKLGTKPGKPLSAPRPQSAPPQTDADALVLHLTARVDHRGSWGEFPSENWIVLSKAEWAKLLPEAGAKPGTAWDIDAAVAGRLLVYFYPQTENNKIQSNRIDRQSLRATMLDVTEDKYRIRLDVSLRMKHAFYPGRDDNNFVDATLVGFLEIDRAKQSIARLDLVTVQATYSRFTFTAALRRP